MSFPHWTELRPVRFLRRFRLTDLLVDAAHGYQLHRSANTAALIAYFGFLTLFPALLLATTILGFVLDGNPELRESIVDTAVGQIPIIGSDILSSTGGFSGSALAICFGVLGALWASARAFVALQNGLDDIWEVPLDGRPNLLVRRLHGLVGLAVIGFGQVATVALTAFVSFADFGFLTQFAFLAVALVVNTAVIATMFRYLTSAAVSWTTVAPGSFFVGVSYTVLQFLGTALVARLLSGAQGVYGTFASVLALTAWISIHAAVALFAAELNAVLQRRRSPA